MHNFQEPSPEVERSGDAKEPGCLTQIFCVLDGLATIFLAVALILWLLGIVK